MAFLFYFILILSLMLLIIVKSKVELEVINLDYERQKNKKLKYLIKLRVYILGIIPIISLKIDKKSLKKLEKLKLTKRIEEKFKKQIQTAEMELIKLISNREIRVISDAIKVLKDLKFQVKKLNLKIKVGVESVVATSFLVPIITTIISLLLRNMDFKLKGNQYEIIPLYNLQNSGNKINISLKCIIQVKMTHIINIIYIIKKQRKVKEDVRTSDRRSYDYSYE